ncbi:glycosyltransferase [Flavobacteriaceae bacterium MHTCC 0001]
MNIAIFSPSRNPYSETFIQAHKKYLGGNVFYYYGTGINIQLEGKNRLMPSGIYKFYRVYAKLFKKKSTYLWFKRLSYSLKHLKIDVVLVEYGTHAHHLYKVLKASKLPVIVHFHGYDASMNNVINACNNYKEVFKLASSVIAVSKAMERKLLTIGCPKEKLVYNVYGPQPEFESVKPTYSKSQFLTIGRFTDKKAPYYTIKAFAKFAKNNPEAKLLMAGNGVLLNTCKNLVKYHNLETQVKFLGIITPEEYRKLLEESLALVQHSVTADDGDMEGTPLAVLEASVSGLPVVSTYHAGIPDVIIHGKTGLLCEEHDVDTMANHMLNLINDLDYAKQLGDAGKKHITTHFNLKNHIDRLQKLLEV